MKTRNSSAKYMSRTNKCAEKLICKGSIHQGITKSSTKAMRLVMPSTMYQNERALAAPSGSTDVHRNRPCAIYTAGDIVCTVSSI